MTSPQETLRLDPQQGLTQANVDRIQQAVERVFADTGLGKATLLATVAVVEELCTNIMEHSGAGWLELTFSLPGGGAHVRIRDNGLPFNPCQAILAQPEDLSGRAESNRKLGLYMVQQLTRGLRCSRDEQGHNQVEFDIRPDLERQSQPDPAPPSV